MDFSTYYFLGGGIGGGQGGKAKDRFLGFFLFVCVFSV